MTHFERLGLTLIIIFISVGAGYCCKLLAWRGKFPIGEECLDLLRHRLQSLAAFLLIPVSAMLSLWGLPKPESGLLALPLLGLLSYVWGGMLALLASRALGLNRAQTGSLYCCGTFTNIGAVGGLVCLLFLGENSIAIVALYRFLEEIYYFSVSFPIARWYGPDNKSPTLTFRAFRLDPILGVIAFALLLGIALNLLGVNRPAPFGAAASALLLCATIFLLFGIGISLRISRLGAYVKPALAVCLIKFLGAPLVITGMAWAIGYGDMEGGLPLKVVAVLSSMPVAMTALLPPALFRLDMDLANACWIFSTLGLIVALPALMLILPAL